jgi:hypothetical protein
MLVELNGENFKVNDKEFLKVHHEVYNNLKIIPELGIFERIVSLLSKLSNVFTYKINLINIGVSHGGYIPIKCSLNFNKIYIFNDDNENIKYNIEQHNIKNININIVEEQKHPYILYINNDTDINDILLNDNPIVVSVNDYTYGKCYKLSNSDLKIYIPDLHFDDFKNIFSYYIDCDNLNYDNLIHLAVIVKNGGKHFESMLKDNINVFDRWTILDTGSTDNTTDIIKNTLQKKEGNLFEEPFVNFKDSRNRCLDLCKTDCKFILILDDTYHVKGDLRGFLNTIRGDQFGTSYSIYIQSDDTQYVSNRIIKSESGLRYIYKIHEVIDTKNNVNVCIPLSDTYIFDSISEFMQKRTLDRKYYDLNLLFEMVQEEPDNPRHLYYIAQTYNLLKKFDLAYDFFLRRAENPNGFIQERVDSYFEAARLANFKLDKKWEICFDLYNKSYNLDKTRPDSLYFIGIHFYLEKDFKTAFEYFKSCFKIGYPEHAQHSLKPTLSFYYLPRYLCELCYIFKDYKLGIETCTFFLKNNTKKDEFHNIVSSLYSMFKNLVNKLPDVEVIKPEKPILCFIADGGFSKWNGSSINKEGVGGSETFIIEISRYINTYSVYVFCNCSKEEVFENVIYMDLSKLYNFISTNYIEKCIVSRYTEYLSLCFESNNIKDVYLLLHDLVPEYTIIPINKKLKKIFCLSEFHKQHIEQYFPCFNNITEVFNYGIDNKFIYNPEIKKIKHKFIYSSFPNRGLSVLLKLWVKIKERLRDASLHIYCDYENTWVNHFYKEEIDEIKKLCLLYKDLDIYNYGWVDKDTLSKAWASSHVWFYPCIFTETFCLTALECAASNTIPIVNDLGSLKEVCLNGIVIPGDCKTIQWQENALDSLFSVLQDYQLQNKIIYNNSIWAKNMLWKNKDFFEKIQDYEYGGMYNWTNDIPIGTKNNFTKILSEYSLKFQNSSCKILEIGTYTGTSIIHIMNFFKFPEGYVIDKWENYIEKNDNKNIEILEKIKHNNIEDKFIKNITKAGFIDKIKIYKGDANEILLDNIDLRFDLIYVDGSHLLLDSYVDIILSWKMLNKGGILIIDDIEYNSNNMIESPYEGVKYFLKKYNTKYKILNSDYRLFLEKL